MLTLRLYVINVRAINVIYIAVPITECDMDFGCDHVYNISCIITFQIHLFSFYWHLDKDINFLCIKRQMKLLYIWNYSDMKQIMRHTCVVLYRNDFIFSVLCVLYQFFFRLLHEVEVYLFATLLYFNIK